MLNAESTDLMICTLTAIREIIRFAWPNRTWAMDVEWAVRKWRGKHIINAAYRALLGSFVYHLWRERNSRRFQQIEHPPNVLASIIIDDVRQRILSLNLSSSISTCALYRLWRITWPVISAQLIVVLYHIFLL